MLFRIVSTLCVVAATTFGRPATTNAAETGPVVVKDYAEALKHLGATLAEKAKTTDLHLVWCFAQSPTMLDDRLVIAKEFSPFYLALADAAKVRGGTADAVVSSVTSYDRAFALHTGRPVNTVSQVALAVTAIPATTIGRKQQCLAVAQAVRTIGPTAKSAKRSLVFVLVTDESGDAVTNVRELEKVVADCQAAACTVFVLGREAMFGAARFQARHVENGLPFWADVDRGPETAEPEILLVAGLRRRDFNVPSGVGPYEQMRLARETGGTFYLLPSPEARLPMEYDQLRVRAEAMRNLQPELSSRAAYVAARDASPLRKAIAGIAAELNPDKNPRAEVRTRQFPLTVPNPTAFRAAANIEVAKAKALVKIYATAETSLAGLKEARDKEPSPRWQANYDLMVAQVAAARIRCEAYAEFLQAAILNPPVVKNLFGLSRPTTEWEISLSKLTDLERGRHRQDIERCLALFAELQKKYKNTPYAEIAAAEIERDFGLKLIEARTEPRR